MLKRMTSARALVHMSDYNLLARMDQEHGNFDLAAECVRRGLAESPQRRMEVSAMGPYVSQAERYLTLAFAEISKQQARNDEETRWLAGWQGKINDVVKQMRRWAAW